MIDAAAIHARNQEVYEFNRMEAGYSPNARIFERSYFNWDTAKAVYGLCDLDPHMALDVAAEYLEQFQNTHGMVPNEAATGQAGPIAQKVQRHILGVSHNPFSPEGTVTSSITQPPLITGAIYEAGMRLPQQERIERWKKLFPALKSQAEWFRAYRTDPADGLVFSTHAFETGMDNTGPWHIAMTEQWLKPANRRDAMLQTLAATAIGLSRRAFADGRHVPVNQRADNYNVLANGRQTRQLGRHNHDIDKILADPQIVLLKDVGMNPTVDHSNRLLRHMAAEIDDPEYTLGQELEAYMDRLHDAIENELWDEAAGTYLSKNMRTGRKIPLQTVASLYPLLNDIPDERAKLLLQDFQDPRKFASDCPSMPLNSPIFNDRGYWLGAIWPFSRMIVYQGLLHHGFEQEAVALADKILSRPSEPHKSEQDNPITGEPLGISRFLPTAALDEYLLHQQNLL
jgi:glycogen debranching enzyme